MLYSIDHCVGIARDFSDRLNMRMKGSSTINTVRQTQDEWGFPVVILSQNATETEGNPVIWVRFTNLFEQSGSPEASPAGAPIDIFGNATLPFTPTIGQIAYELTAGTFTITSATYVSGDVYTSAAGQSFTVTASGTSTTLPVSGAFGPSPATGTLTRASGSGPTTLTYSAFAGFNPEPAGSDFSTVLFEMARTGCVVQEYYQPNGTAVTEASITPANLAKELKDIDWRYSGNT